MRHWNFWSGWIIPPARFALGLIIALTVAGFAFGFASMISQKPTEVSNARNLHPIEEQISHSMSESDSAPSVTIASKSVRVEVAETPSKREQGLSGRHELPPDMGMLFLFDSDGKWGFWMKDMWFPIDIIWISVSGRIVYIVPHATPASYPRVFVPSEDARYVLEVPAGTAESGGWKIGDVARFSNVPGI